MGGLVPRGAEQQKRFNASASAADFLVLQQLLEEIFPDMATRPMLVGPDVSGFKPGHYSQEHSQYLLDFATECHVRAKAASASRVVAPSSRLLAPARARATKGAGLILTPVLPRQRLGVEMGALTHHEYIEVSFPLHDGSAVPLAPCMRISTVRVFG
jgi:hypothetical protein